MPLTKRGKAMYSAFQREYGERGKGVFYAYARKHKGLHLVPRKRR